MSLTVENLAFSYGAENVLSDVSFSAEAGQALFVLGANGAGKTTLFRCILGLLQGYTGKIAVDGTDARTLSPKELARRVAYIPQSHGGAFCYTALDMVLMGAAHGIPFYSAPKAREMARAKEALCRLGIEGLQNKSFSHLSGGEQQLVLIARALAQNANTLLFDEPTANLDYGNQARVLDTVRSLSADGCAVVITTHNPQHALTFADRVLALSDGLAAAFGPPQVVLTSDLIEKLYGVTSSILYTENGPVLTPMMKRRPGACSVGANKASNT